MSERPPPHDEGPDPDETGELRIPPPSPDPEPAPGEPVGHEPSGSEPADAAAQVGQWPAGESPAPACAVCASPLDADQTYCLQCGAPTPLAPALRRRGRTVGLAVAALVVLGLGAGTLAYAVAGDDEEPGATTSAVPTSGIVTVPTTTVPPPAGTLPPDTSVTPPTVPTVPTGLPTTPTAPTVLPTAPTVPTIPTTPTVATVPTTPTTPTVPTVAPPAPVPPPAPTPTPPPTDSFQSDWPAGTSGWTAVLSSVRDVNEAVGTRDRIQSSGEPAGVLLSSDYQDLRRGYYVVFSGVFDTKADALAQIARLEADHPDAYPARIVPG